MKYLSDTNVWINFLNPDESALKQTMAKTGTFTNGKMTEICTAMGLVDLDYMAKCLRGHYLSLTHSLKHIRYNDATIRAA